jgi:hypothetical protein
MQFSKSWFCSKSFRGFFGFWWKVGGGFLKISGSPQSRIWICKVWCKQRGKFSTEKNPWISELCGAPVVWTHHLENTQLVQWMQLCKHLPTPPTPRALRERDRERERERRPDWTPGFVTIVVGKCPVPCESRGSEMPSQLLPPFYTVPVGTLDYHLKNMF